MENTFYAVQYKKEGYLDIIYVSRSVKRSSVNIVDTEFRCFSTEKGASDYIIEGDDVFYSYESMNIDRSELKVIKLTSST